METEPTKSDAIKIAQSLPDLSSDYPLTSEQIAGFQRDGHILLRNVLSPEEVAAYRPVISEVTDRYNYQTLPVEQRDTYGKAFIQIGNLWQRDEAAAKFTLSRRFAKIAADLMSVDGVRLYHDQALFKEPGGGGTPWHQDQFYWPLECKTVTLWMPMVDIPEEVGSMNFGTGSQELGYLGDMPISDESEKQIRRLIEERHIPVNSYGAMKAGDATFHNGWTLHGAKPNPTPKMREVMTIIYYADGAYVSEPKNKAQVSDLKCLGGCKPGELAISDVNPLLYNCKK